MYGVCLPTYLLRLIYALILSAMTISRMYQGYIAFPGHSAWKMSYRWPWSWVQLNPVFLFNKIVFIL